MSSFVTTEEWYGFTTSFFKVDLLWLAHVQRNWNHLKNEPSCLCYFGDKGSEYCNDFVEMKKAIKEQEALRDHPDEEVDGPLGEKSELY